MKNSKYILLIIGLLGVIASVYGYLKDNDIQSNLVGLICGASLIYGYFELNKINKKNKS